MVFENVRSSLMNPLRRMILKGTGAAGAVAVAAAVGLLVPRRVLAIEWNKAAFEAKTLADALKDLGVVSPGKALTFRSKLRISRRTVR